MHPREACSGSRPAPPSRTKEALLGKERTTSADQARQRGRGGRNWRHGRSYQSDRTRLVHSSLIQDGGQRVSQRFLQGLLGKEGGRRQRTARLHELLDDECLDNRQGTTRPTLSLNESKRSVFVLAAEVESLVSRNDDPVQNKNNKKKNLLYPLFWQGSEAERAFPQEHGGQFIAFRASEGRKRRGRRLLAFFSLVLV